MYNVSRLIITGTMSTSRLVKDPVDDLQLSNQAVCPDLAGLAINAGADTDVLFDDDASDHGHRSKSGWPVLTH